MRLIRELLDGERWESRKRARRGVDACTLMLPKPDIQLPTDLPPVRATVQEAEGCSGGEGAIANRREPRDCTLEWKPDEQGRPELWCDFGPDEPQQRYRYFRRGWYWYISDEEREHYYRHGWYWYIPDEEREDYHMRLGARCLQILAVRPLPEGGRGREVKRLTDICVTCVADNLMGRRGDCSTDAVELQRYHRACDLLLSPFLPDELVNRVKHPPRDPTDPVVLHSDDAVMRWISRALGGFPPSGPRRDACSEVFIANLSCLLEETGRDCLEKEEEREEEDEDEDEDEGEDESEDEDEGEDESEDGDDEDEEEEEEEEGEENA